MVIFMFGFCLEAHAAEAPEDYQAVFDWEYYYNSNPDLQESIGSEPEKLLWHFMTSGAREGRSGDGEFNLKAYVFYNKDLLDVYQTNWSAYCGHYVAIGKAEGRICAFQGDEGNLMGTYTTFYDPTIPRAVNVELAASRIGGVVVQPGEVFSFSAAVLPRRPENGYVLAPAIGGYEYGGGICQVSSTLYAAMCHGMMPVLERFPHSSPVSYLPRGLDATISEGHKDLKFVNVWNEPLTIQTEAREGSLTVSLWKGDMGQTETLAEEETENQSQERGPGV